MVLSLILPVAVIAGLNQAEAKHRGFLDTNNQVSDEAPAAMATNPSEAYKTKAQDTYNNAIDDTKNYVGDKAEKAGDYISDKASDAKDYAKDKYKDAKKYVNEKTDNAENYAKNKKHDYDKKHDCDKMKNKGHWLEKETKEINEDFDEANYKIEKSQLSADQKNILKKQAKENRDLALKQAKERSDLMKEQRQAREAFRDDIMKDKSNRKAVKEVNDIL